MLRHIYLYYTIIRQKNIYFIFICFIPELKAGTVLNFLQELKLRKIEIGDSSQLSQKNTSQYMILCWRNPVYNVLKY